MSELNTFARICLPGTPFWRINREWLTGLAAGRALLLQLAHPLVAAGVAQHSSYRQEPLRRLWRTMRVMFCLTFGEGPPAELALRHFHRCHGHVRGVLPHPLGRFPAGTPYDARDPKLQFWVLATLIDSAVQAYELFVAPLTPAEKEAYYQEALRLACRMGIPESCLPCSFDEFSAYVQAMLNSGELCVGETAQQLVAALLAPSLVGVLARGLRLVTAGMLPEDLRHAYHLPWDPVQEQRFQRLAAACRDLRAQLPEALCVHPLVLAAEWRLRHHSAGDAVLLGE